MNTSYQIKRNDGFTLMELLIVMAIMSILTIIVTGALASSSRRGRDSRRKNDLQSIATALESYYNDKGHYPNGQGGVMAGCGMLDEQLCNWGLDFKDSKGTLYMVFLPKDPTIDQGLYQYYYKSNSGLDFQLYGKLENTQDQGDGVNQGGYQGTNCGPNPSSTVLCTYVVTSSNLKLAPTPTSGG